MPKDCHSCPMCLMRFCQAGDRELSEQEIRPNVKRPEDCPLVPVPETHGRLIDADALINEFKILQSGREIFGMELDSSFLSSGQELSTEWYCVEDAIEDAPTIIEAEEGE